MTKPERTHKPAVITLGEGGWAVYPYPEPDTRHGTTARISGYGPDWREYLPLADPECPVVDIRRALHDDVPDVVTFVVSGPMVGADVPAGHINSFSSGIIPFDPRPVIGRPERCARLGNARGFDYAAPDVYAGIARAYGIPVYTAAECLADADLGSRP